MHFPNHTSYMLPSKKKQHKKGTPVLCQEACSIGCIGLSKYIYIYIHVSPPFGYWFRLGRESWRRDQATPMANDVGSTLALELQVKNLHPTKKKKQTVEHIFEKKTTKMYVVYLSLPILGGIWMIVCVILH